MNPENGFNPESDQPNYESGNKIENNLSETLTLEVNKAIATLESSEEEEAVIEMNGMKVRPYDSPIEGRDVFAVHELEGKKYLIYT
jgi:hypothetical protein